MSKGMNGTAGKGRKKNGAVNAAFDGIIQVYNLFEEKGFADPLAETLRLCDLASGGSLRNLDLSLLDERCIDLAGLVEKRKENTPLEYILGRAVFMGRTFHCTLDTLIPTEETRLLVETAASIVRERRKSSGEQAVIEIGTGCGNIAVSLALLTGDAGIHASDISSGAIDVARKNVEKFKLEERVSLYCGDLFEPFRELGLFGATDAVVCNPPYIPSGSLDRLHPEIAKNPKVALDAGPYGINFYLRLINESLSVLKPGGILVFEIGEGQEKLVERLFRKNAGYGDRSSYRQGDEDTVRVMSAARES